MLSEQCAVPHLFFRADPSGANRTAAFLFARARKHSRLPDMSLFALPPDLAFGPGGDHFGCQRAVEFGLPFVCDIRIHDRQVVEPRQDAPPGAIGTANRALGARFHHRGVRMPLAALPPDLAIGPVRYHLGRQGAVSIGMPFGCNGRVQRCQIIFSRQRHTAGTDRTAGLLSGAGRNTGLLDMSLFAQPPDLSARAGCDLIGTKRAVPCRMPLPGQRRIAAGEVIFAGFQPAAGTDRTAAACNAGFDLCTPLVSVFTHPPDGLMTARQDLFGRQGKIFGRMPFCRYRRRA